MDGLRAIAVLLVIVSHAFTRWDGTGPVGVGVFFVLSGFLITAILDQERERTDGVNLKHFYVRRALRLYPALVVFCAVYAGGLVLDVWHSSIGKGLATIAMSLTYTTDVFTLIAHGRWPSSELLHTWSLAVEEQFYVLWPVTFLFLMRKRRPIVFLGVGIVAAMVVRAVASTQAAIALTPLTWTDALLIGCALAIAFRNGWITPRRFHPVVLVIAAAPAAWISYNNLSRFDQIIGLTLFDLGVAVWIIHALAPTAKHNILGSALLVHLGRLSYAMYLWHRLVQAALDHWLDVNTIPYCLVLVTGTIAVSELSYRFVEQPFLRRKERFAVAS